MTNKVQKYECGCSVVYSIIWPFCTDGQLIKDRAYSNPDDVQAWQELEKHFPDHFLEDSQ